MVAYSYGFSVVHDKVFVCLLSVNLDRGGDEEDAALHHFSADF